MSQSLPLTLARRNALLAEHAAMTAALIEGVQADALSFEERQALVSRCEGLLAEYHGGLPRPVLSRCPFCAAPLHHSVDPWGFDGFWWQEEMAPGTREPDPCPHFGVLQGSVRLVGEAAGGGTDARLGPGVPFVIPRILEQDSVVAVIMEFPLAGSHTAWAIAYFAGEPLPRSAFTQPWTRSSFSWLMPAGRYAWRADTDPWDFDLEPWVKREKVLWIERGDREATVRSIRSGPCPYLGVEGVREVQFIRGDRQWTTPPPAGEGVDPFTP
jgi:hypothetical protein